MGYTIETVPVAKLLLDESNPRLEEPEESQREAITALAEQQGRKLIELAKDIVEHGIDPLTMPAVVATEGRARSYRVVEGNRRTLTLKALETPTLISSTLEDADRRQLAKLSEQFHQAPIEEVACVLFDTEEEARHWIRLRHTGQNSGAGVVEWNSDEKDRFEARHGERLRTLGGQALDFLKDLDGSPANGTPRVPVTTVTRLLRNPAVRDLLGLDLERGRLLAHYPQEEVARGLRRIAQDLREEKIKVGNVMEKAQQIEYVQGFAADDLPDPATKLPAALPFEEAPTSGPKRRRPKQRPTKARPRPATERATLIPAHCQINPPPPRANAVFNELATLDADQFANAASVLLRVFLEISVDHYLEQKQVMDEKTRNGAILAIRLRTTAEHLHAAGEIPDQLFRAIELVANGGRHAVAASVATFHQYVHNPYVHPRSTELKSAWDELQPFLERVWA